MLRELPADKYSRLSEINAYFEKLKKYIRNYEVETALAKDLMERWIETRLWNQKVKNESITIRQIIFELSALFKINVTP